MQTQVTIQSDWYWMETHHLYFHRLRQMEASVMRAPLLRVVKQSVFLFKIQLILQVKLLCIIGLVARPALQLVAAIITLMVCQILMNMK